VADVPSGLSLTPPQEIKRKKLNGSKRAVLQIMMIYPSDVRVWNKELPLLQVLE
jgi:hypothetical protein